MASGHVNRTYRGRTHGRTDQYCTSEESPCQFGAVHTWPLTSFTALQKCGRYRRKSGQTAPSGMIVSAAFDPFQTLQRKA
jgi:hypothetical protein